jgi:hypothetical protein
VSGRARSSSTPRPPKAGADQNITLEYLAFYAEPAADGDTIATPTRDDDILQALVCADAMRWIGSDEAKASASSRAAAPRPRAPPRPTSSALARPSPTANAGSASAGYRWFRDKR